MPRPPVRRLAHSAVALPLATLLYAAVAPSANAAGLDAATREDLREMRDGTMTKLVVHDEARARPEGTFLDGEGAQTTLADFAGRVVLVNFWATWCPPCRAEMPSIDALAEGMAGEDFAVVALSTDFGGLAKPRGFFQEIGVENLPLYLDADKEVSRAAGVTGLPVTLLLDREGREVARLIGDAHWDEPAARAIVSRLIEATGGAGC